MLLYPVNMYPAYTYYSGTFKDTGRHKTAGVDRTCVKQWNDYRDDDILDTMVDSLGSRLSKEWEGERVARVRTGWDEGGRGGGGENCGSICLCRYTGRFWESAEAAEFVKWATSQRVFHILLAVRLTHSAKSLRKKQAKCLLISRNVQFYRVGTHNIIVRKIEKRYSQTSVHQQCVCKYLSNLMETLLFILGVYFVSWCSGLGGFYLPQTAVDGYSADFLWGGYLLEVVWYWWGEGWLDSKNSSHWLWQ